MSRDSFVCARGLHIYSRCGASRERFVTKGIGGAGKRYLPSMGYMKIATTIENQNRAFFHKLD